MTKEERKARDEDFENRLQPRMVWPSQFRGTAIRVRDGYREKPVVAKKKHALTEAQDNAVGRAIRRRQNKAMKGWRPHAKR